jgi:hypothetical protein
MSLLSIVAGGADRPLLGNREKWRTPVTSGQPTKTDTSYTLPGEGAHPPEAEASGWIVILDYVVSAGSCLLNAF